MYSEDIQQTPVPYSWQFTCKPPQRWSPEVFRFFRSGGLPKNGFLTGERAGSSSYRGAWSPARASSLRKSNTPIRIHGYDDARTSRLSGVRPDCPCFLSTQAPPLPCLDSTGCLRLYLSNWNICRLSTQEVRS